MADEGDSNLLPRRKSLSLEAVFGFGFGRQPVNLVELANGDEPDRLAKNAALGFLAKRAETFAAFDPAHALLEAPLDEINVGVLEPKAMHRAGDEEGGREVREIDPFLAGLRSIQQ